MGLLFVIVAIEVNPFVRVNVGRLAAPECDCTAATDRQQELWTYKNSVLVKICQPVPTRRSGHINHQIDETGLPVIDGSSQTGDDSGSPGQVAERLKAPVC
jgi:hypothetical protein